MIEDGRAFCPQCRAPQIHVQIASPEPLASISSSSIDDLPTGVSLETSSPRTYLGQGGSRRILDRRSAVRAALKAGVLGFFIGAVPFVGIILTGYLAVYFYRRDRGLVPVAALSSRLGGAAGVVTFAINAFWMIVLFVFHTQQYVDSLTRLASKMGVDPADPNIQSTIRNLSTPAGLVVSLFLGMFFAVALASIGGALAAFFLRTRNPSP